jgi:hypothetical protein
VYQKLSSHNFSKTVLEILSFENRQNLRVLPVQGVTWKDWGTSDRVSKTLRQLVPADCAPPEPALLERRPLRVSSGRNLAVARTIR